MPYLSSDDHDRDDRHAFYGGLLIVGLGVLALLHVLGVIDLLQ